MPALPQLPFAIEPDSIITVCHKYLKLNEGDTATQDILLAMTADMLNISTDALSKAIEYIDNES